MTRAQIEAALEANIQRERTILGKHGYSSQDSIRERLGEIGDEIYSLENEADDLRKQLKDIDDLPDLCDDNTEEVEQLREERRRLQSALSGRSVVVLDTPIAQ